jgi:hypothetical protein
MVFPNENTTHSTGFPPPSGTALRPARCAEAGQGDQARHVPVGERRAHAPRDLVAVEAWQADVEQDHVRRVRLHALQMMTVESST